MSGRKDRPEIVGVGFPSGNFSAQQSFFAGEKPLLSIPFLFSDVVLCEDHLPMSEQEDDCVPEMRVIRWRSVEMWEEEEEEEKREERRGEGGKKREEDGREEEQERERKRERDTVRTSTHPHT